LGARHRKVLTILSESQWHAGFGKCVISGFWIGVTIEHLLRLTRAICAYPRFDYRAHGMRNAGAGALLLFILDQPIVAEFGIVDENELPRRDREMTEHPGGEKDPLPGVARLVGRQLAFDEFQNRMPLIASTASARLPRSTRLSAES
jgi:hypothetical protein